MNYIFDDDYADDLETDRSTVTFHGTGTIASTFRRHGRKHITVFARDDKRRPLVLTIRLAATHNPNHFRVGRKIRITNIVGKLGPELMLAFPTRKRAVA